MRWCRRAKTGEAGREGGSPSGACSHSHHRSSDMTQHTLPLHAFVRTVVPCCSAMVLGVVVRCGGAGKNLAMMMLGQVLWWSAK